MARLNAKIAEARRVEGNRQRKDDTRYRLAFGSCLLADLAEHSELRSTFEQCLKRTAGDQNTELFRERGWKI